MPVGTFETDEQNYSVFLVDEIFSISTNYTFSGLGFEATLRIGSSTSAIFPQPGDKYATYSSSDNGWHRCSGWFEGSTHVGDKLFNKVGAACYISLSRIMY